MTNKERIAKAIEALHQGLRPFVEREMAARFQARWEDEIISRMRATTLSRGKLHLDVQLSLKCINVFWDDVFCHQLDKAHRSFVHEAIEIRNQNAHDHAWSSDDTDRALDTLSRLLVAMGAAQHAAEIVRSKEELRRQVYQEQARNKVRYQANIASTPLGGLKPWRELITPHRDVQTGRYSEAEFAADLGQVYRGQGSAEYLDPAEFFRRTFITSGLGELLTGALIRIAGKAGTQAGDPVVELQTNFGGGKTHSMLALYHLFGDTPSEKLFGVEEVLRNAGVAKSRKAHRAVLVGTSLSPAQTDKKPDGTVVHTLWGEMAWQLGGKAGYALVADSDKRATAPGANVLEALFTKFSPALVLIDEWVAYARQLYGEKPEMPGGRFESQVSFAQSLTEAAKRVPHTLVVASIPQSRIEIGGDYGDFVLSALKDSFFRVATQWRPATADEGFEIVRRRLFEATVDVEAAKHRDAVLREFLNMYRKHASEYPQGVGEAAYERKMLAAYPIHPELFERLYNEWSTLDKFQRTRGVLRLLAKVIHQLWESGDKSLMIMPSSIPLDMPEVRSEIGRYLSEQWDPILSQDIDGIDSLPMRLDSQTPTLGRISAARKVARAIYVGSAPGTDGLMGEVKAGVDDRSIRLACVQPGETAGTYGDALRRIASDAKYIHQDGSRYWVSTRANLNRLAAERAAEQMRDRETLWNDLRKRVEELHKKKGGKGEFSAVHVFPDSPADVADEPVTRLVILPPTAPHKDKKRTAEESTAIELASELLQFRGSGPRTHVNCLVFAAATAQDMDLVAQAIADYRAWTSIFNEHETLNLTPYFKRQAEQKCAEWKQVIDQRLQNAWCYVLVPRKEDASAPLEWDQRKLNTQQDGSIAQRAWDKVKTDLVLAELGPQLVRRMLDKLEWAKRPHIPIAELQSWYTKQLYFEKVLNAAVVTRAVQAGVALPDASQGVAIAQAWDVHKARYQGLRIHETVESPTDDMLVVQPEVAMAQQQREQTGPGRRHQDSVVPPFVAHGTEPGVGQFTNVGAPTISALPRKFVGAKVLPVERMASHFAKLQQEVLEHLVHEKGARVKVRVEIEIDVPDGISEEKRRVVAENARTLKFDNALFEGE